MSSATPKTPETELTPELIERVMKLSPENRQRLIGLLGAAEPVPVPPPVGDAAYWKAEIARRIEAIQNGTMKTYTLEEAVAYWRQVDADAREEHAAERLRVAPETVYGLAGELGVSERSLRQAFLDHIGTSPKRFARIERVLGVVADAGRTSWARLAAEHDFYDQPHLNAEFRALLGVSPGQFLAGQLPFVRKA